MTRVFEVVATSAACGGFALVTYLVVTYATMVRQAQGWRWRALLKDAAREAWWVLLSQPLLPLYFFAGRKMGGQAGGQPVVLVHGYAQNRAAFWWLARRLRAARLGPIYAINYPFLSSIAANADRLERFVAGVRRETSKASVDLVCHSMGGLVAMHYLRRARDVRRCVTIASPHAGVLWRLPIPGVSGLELRKDSEFLRTLGDARANIPVLSVTSTGDNVVFPASTSALLARGGTDELVDAGGHLSILFNQRVASLVVQFLSQPAPPSATVAVVDPLETATKAGVEARPGGG